MVERSSSGNKDAIAVKRKLVFYSNQVRPDTEEIDRRLLALLGKEKPRIGYIPSVSDPTEMYYQAQKAYYRHYDIDLEPCFGLDNRYTLDDLGALLTADAIHLSGGNTFYFLHWLRVRNMLDTIKQYVERGGVLIGVSAGAILMTPDIRTTLLCGDVLPPQEIAPQGLGLVDFAFVPHWGSYAAMEEIKSYSRKNSNQVIYACSDNGGIIVENEHVQLVGDVSAIKNGSVYSPE